MSEETLQFDILQLMEMLPHRYPFLLVDRITECVPGKYCKGYKNLTFNELFFQGHFPNNPIMPGVLQLEAMAQLGAGILMPLPEYANKLVLYAGVDSARFKRVVRPGDRLDMETELIKVKGPIVKAHAKAFVDGKLACEADLMFSMVDKK
ncbi:MAG: 3-hydroxyacyl-ACP dehydratase FabZ [Candidatus Gastranaerophilales bacterium]|nr:3-hydroxyacyl-ACP dehydratase FabZ [Candidatus Gastranaerophilales bacterium]